MKIDYTNLYSLIKNEEWAALKEELTKLDVLALIDLIERSNELQSTILFRFLPMEKAKYVLHALDRSRRNKIIDGLAQHATLLTNLMNNMEPDDRTALFEELPGKVAQKLMQLLSQENRQQATQLLGYPEQSIGRLMTPRYVALKSHFTVRETLQHIRSFGKDAETLGVVYVVDSDWRLINDLRIRDILLANPEEIRENEYRCF